MAEHLLTLKLLHKSFSGLDLSFTFPKSSRFRNKSETNSEFYTIPSALSKRSTSFGFGKRSELRISTCSPGPSRYAPMDVRNLGFTLPRAGVGSRLRQKSDDNPGPGAYDLNYSEGSAKYSIRGKERERKADTGPCASNYNPIFKSVQKQKYSAIGFGYGKKEAYGINQNNPGPGAYSLPQTFPKITITKPLSFLTMKSSKVMKLKRKLTIKNSEI